MKIPKNFDYPRPQKIDGLRGVHNVNSDNIVIVDAQTLLVPSLSYDGEAPGEYLPQLSQNILCGVNNSEFIRYNDKARIRFTNRRKKK